MVKIDQRNFQTFCDIIEMIMVKLAHSTASIFLIFLEKCMFCKLESFLVKQFLVFIRSFCLKLCFSFDLFQDCFLMLAQLLQLNISEFAIIKELIQDYIEILISGVFVCDWFHLVGNLLNSHGSLLVRKLLVFLITFHSSKKQFIIKSLNFEQIVNSQNIPLVNWIMLAKNNGSNLKQIIEKKIMSKLRPVKSALSMTTPKGSLIAQINNLRKELKDYKQVKKQDTLLSQKPMKDISSSMNKKSPQKCITSINGSMKDKFFNQSKQDWKSPKSKNTTNWAFQTQKSYFETQKKDKPTKKNSSKDSTIQEQKQVSEIQLNSIQLKQKDRRLKMDIEINKLRKTIKKLGPQEIAQQLNYIIGLLNGSIKEYLSRIEYLQKNQKQDSSDQALLIKRQQEQIQEMARKISQNQQQIRNLSLQLKTRDDSDLKLQQLQQKVQTQKQQLRVEVEALQAAFKESQMKVIQFEEQNRILQTKLMKKQEQLIMLNEDINYLRIQTENYKEQKKEFSQLYQNTLMELRQVKRAKTSEIEKLTEERLKWENECKLRRNESEQLTALEEQKLALIKQLTEMRHLCSLKNKELQDKKALLHENQRKMITLESEVYKLKSELQIIRNQNEFAQFQNQKLRQQLQDIKKYTRNNRSKQKLLPAKKSLQKDHQPLSLNKNQDFTDKTVLKQAQNQEQSFDFTRVQEKKQSYNKKLREKQDKLKTLEDIHSLIKKHRKQMQI